MFFCSLRNRCGVNEGRQRKTEELVFPNHKWMTAKASGKDEHMRWMIDVRGWFGQHVFLILSLYNLYISAKFICPKLTWLPQWNHRCDRLHSTAEQKEGKYIVILPRMLCDIVSRKCPICQSSNSFLVFDWCALTECVVISFVVEPKMRNLIFSTIVAFIRFLMRWEQKKSNYISMGAPCVRVSLSRTFDRIHDARESLHSRLLYYNLSRRRVSFFNIYCVQFE